jgi:hypothetical protein
MDFKSSFLVHPNVFLLKGQIRYICFWGLIEEDYWKMISSSLVNKTLNAHGITKSIIKLIHKVKAVEELSNSKLINFLSGIIVFAKPL